MRILLLSLVAVCCAAAAIPAQAEQRVFIILDRTHGSDSSCLASGNACGAMAADAYCRSHGFAAATSFHKVDRADITGIIPAEPAGCRRGKCRNVVAIVCTR